MTVTAQGLVLDYGGVLTPSVGRMFRDFEQAHDLPRGTLFEVVAAAYGDGGDDSEIGRLERGELAVDEFEVHLAAALAERGYDVPSDGLAGRIHGQMVPAGRLWDATRIARRAGIRTALLSNSWGVDGYPSDLFDDHFDVVVISAAVGIRKPDPAIWHLTCERLGVGPGACVFVDDLERNLAVARSLGMVGILADADTDRVLADLTLALGVDVTGAQAM